MQQRIELNAHSTFETMDSVLTLEDMLEFAYNNEMPALALTDLNCVQGFPKFSEYCDIAVIKPIFGAQIIHSDFNSGYPFISTILVKNQTGLKNLYRIISTLKNDGVCNNVPIEVLEENHEGLLYGSAGHDGPIFNSYKYNDFECFEKFTRFYDYFEIENFYGNKDEEKVNKMIVNLAKDIKKLVVAVSNARYIDKKDSICLNILDSRTKRWNNNVKNLHFRTAEEMINEFSYLNDDAKDIVINNPKKIADVIEKIYVFPERSFESVIDNAYKEVKMLATGFCSYKYGGLDPLDIPKAIKDRLETELNLPVVKKCADKLLLARHMVNEVKIHNKVCCACSTVAASFLSYCLGITKTNPLPPHYYCPKCKTIEWVDSVSCGYDLSDKKCQCGGVMKGDGMNLSYEGFFDTEGKIMSNIAIATNNKMQDIISNKINKEYNINLAFTSMISTVSKVHALNLILEYEKESGKSFSDNEKTRIIKKLEQVKKTNEIHPSKLLIFPKNTDVLDFTPIIEDKYHGLQISHLCASDLKSHINNIYIVPCEVIDFLHTLESETGISINDVPINASSMFELIKNYDLKGITEFNSECILEMIKIAKPKSFSDLMKISGLSCGTNTWKSNAESLIKNGICTLKEIPAFRDDIYNDLINHGLEKRKAYKYAEITRKGLFAKNQLYEKDVEEFLIDLKSIGMPDWYIDYCKKIQHMFPKALSAEYVRIATIEAWYKINNYNLFN